MGERDLALGIDWLARAARDAGVPLLAANLRAAGGARPFAAHRIVEVAGERVGIFAVLDAGALPEGATLDDPAATARAEATALRAAGATLVVALLHAGTERARALVAGLAADVAIAAHDARRIAPEPRDPVLLAEPSDRGRDLSAIAIHLSTGGRWADLAAPGRAAAERESIERWIATARGRLARAEGEADRKALRDFIALQEERAEDASRRSRVRPEGRLFEPILLPLDDEAPVDGLTDAEVAAVLSIHGEPPGGGE